MESGYDLVVWVMCPLFFVSMVWSEEEVVGTGGSWSQGSDYEPIDFPRVIFHEWSVQGKKATIPVGNRFQLPFVSSSHVRTQVY
ncbi:hypothetical protein V6N13_126605 [Hibiscus sabdariffa]